MRQGHSSCSSHSSTQMATPLPLLPLLLCLRPPHTLATQPFPGTSHDSRSPSSNVRNFSLAADRPAVPGGQAAVLPRNEEERMAALLSYKVLDTEPEQAFDQLAVLASQICQTPIALVSLIDTDRQWFKSKVGLAENETHRDMAFCAHAILHDEVFEVADATNDFRYTYTKATSTRS